MFKIFRNISLGVLAIVLLNFFSYFIYISTKAPNSFGVLSKITSAFAKFPETIKTVLKSKEFEGIPPSYIKNYVKTFNKLDYDVWGLNASYNKKENKHIISLNNLRTERIEYQWFITPNLIQEKKINFQNYEILNPLVFPDKSLIFFIADSNNLIKIDKNSKIIWKNSSIIPHHSMNLDNEGKIWVCTVKVRKLETKNKTYSFNDHAITQIDPTNGKIIFDKSITDILLENNEASYVYGIGNATVDKGIDPLHLNDIEPVFKDTHFAKTGDLLISLRNRSMFFVYSPITNKIKKIVHKNLINQHDVDVLNDDEVAIFSNNRPVFRGTSDNLNRFKNQDIKKDKFYNSSIYYYNFKKDSMYSPYQNIFDKEKIYTGVQGCYTILKNGDVFVEETMKGNLYIFDKNNIKLKTTIPTKMEGYIDTPKWMRIYEELPFKK